MAHYEKVANPESSNPYLPIYRFHEDGTPLVVWEGGIEGGREAGLVPAAELPSHHPDLIRFTGLYSAAYHHSAFPATPGWRVQVREAGRSFVAPVAAWAFDQYGTLHPFSLNEAGKLDVNPWTKGELIPPGQTDYEGSTS